MKLLKEHLYNQYLRFTENGDPIEDMGIGLKSRIEEWLKNAGINDYRFTKKFSINVYHTTLLSDKGFTDFPVYIKFNHISGGFHCDNNELTSLKGGPYSVTGSFMCSYNNLKDLQFGPRVVKQSYGASYNNLKSLEGIAEIIGESLYINNNELSTLEYIPSIIKGNLSICSNPITTLQYFPKEVYGDIHYSPSQILSETTIKNKCKVKGNIIKEI